METEEVKVVEPQPEPITMKDPKKVEQGKKLAAISKAAKEKKMRAKIEAEMEEKKIRIPAPLLIGVPVVGGYLMYRHFFAKKSAPAPLDPTPVREPSPPPEKKRSPSPPPKKFETLD